jgi:hypothetical protein
MTNRRSYKAECIHTVGTPEFERLKVAAPNLFRPTAFPLSQEFISCYCDTVSPRGEGWVGEDHLYTFFCNIKVFLPAIRVGP